MDDPSTFALNNSVLNVKFSVRRLAVLVFLQLV